MENCLFCCSNLQPYRPKTLDHETKFSDFISWTKRASLGTSGADGTLSETPGNKHYHYAVQLVRQVNYGRLESKRYFVPEDNPGRDFVEITIDDLVDANFEKVNSYKNFKCFIHNKFFEVNLYQKDPVNQHHWRATISRPAEEIDIPAKLKGAVSQHLLNKSPTQGIEQPHIPPKSSPDPDGITFSNDPTFGTLSLTLPSLAADFRGDLLSLVVLDVLASKVKAPVSLVPAWMKLLSVGEIVRFIIDSALGYELFASAETEPLIRAIESRVATSELGLRTHLPCRTRLGELLLDMIEQLSRETEDEMTAVQADFCNSNFVSAKFEDASNKATRHDRCNIRSEEGLKKKDLLEMVRQALDMVHNGPSPSFRIDLYRQARGFMSSRACDANGMELLNGRLPERHNSAVIVPGLVPEFWCSDTGVDIGALSESDNSERWNYSRHNNYVDNGYEDNGYDSPRDLTACDKECGYCGHCDY